MTPPLWRRRQLHPTPVLLPGKSHGQRSLVGCSPWGCWESDMTEQLHFDFSLSCVGEGNGNPLSVLSWRILGTGKPGGLQSMGSHRVGHDWSDLVAAAAAVLKIRSLKSDLFRSHLISWPHFVTSLTSVAVSLRWQERWAPLHSSFWGIKDSVVEKNFKDCQGYNISASRWGKSQNAMNYIIINS